jgi:hypothetical protein
MQKLFPGMRPDGIARERRIVAFLQMIVSAILLVCIAYRQIVHTIQREPGYLISPNLQARHQLRKNCALNNDALPV